MSELAALSARELLDGYASHAFSPVEVVEALAERIARLDPALGAFTALRLEQARDEAAAAGTRYLRAEPVRPLEGVPVAIKDLIDTGGLRTAYGSRMFATHVPTHDAPAVARLRAAGAIVLGKTQTHEFAWGISSVNEAMGTARNPWDRTRISGGSSGGSAVALAARLVPLALGSDTGGSIRIPSAFCGTVGLKPSYGLISTDGVFPLAPSLDHLGPMARTPADAGLLLAVLTGATTDRSRGGADAAPLQGLRLGVCPELSPLELEPSLAALTAEAVARLGGLGAEPCELALPEALRVAESYLIIQRAEALDVHARAGLYPQRASEYGADVGRWLALATEVELPEYLAAGRAREQLRRGFARVFEQVELLVSPVTACGPFAFGQETLERDGRSLTLRELVLPFTVPQDLAGLPACTVRAGFDLDGLPVAIQLTGPPGGEARVLAAAQALYAATAELQGRWPELGASASAAAPAPLGRPSGWVGA
jgi:aspartyl-tRNA(Asn)/glutamyl-tRNA(Gln) amidotransferase subunit A